MKILVGPTIPFVGDYNTKQKGGAIAFFTRGVMDRKKLYVQGVTLALIPFVNERLYFGG
jgi:non-canonical (house-cleaning) NTP pyrophosphatase